MTVNTRNSIYLVQDRYNRNLVKPSKGNLKDRPLTIKHTVLCKHYAIMNKSHLSECGTLRGDNLTASYWDAIGKMMEIN